MYLGPEMSEKKLNKKIIWFKDLEVKNELSSKFQS